MDISKQILDNLVSSSNYPADIKLSLRADIASMNREVNLQFIAPQVVTPKLSVELVKEYSWGKVLINRLELHDGTYVDVFSNSAVEHYTSSHVLIGNIPFSFDDAGFVADHGYNGVYTACAVNTVIDTTPTSFLIISSKINHYIQVYKYTSRVWEHYASIGNPEDPSESENLLYNPTTISAYFKISLKLAACCLGEDDEHPHIKLFTITDSSAVEDHKILYAGYSSQQAAFEGKLEGDEVSSVQAMGYFEKYLVVSSGDQFGIFDMDVDFSTEKPKVIQMVNDGFAFNSFGELLTIPKSFLVTDGLIIAGDAIGHIFRVSFADLSVIDLDMGAQGGEITSIKRSGYNDLIKSVTRVGGKINYVTRNAVYQTNFNSIPDGQSLTYEIVKPDKSLRIISYAGFTNKEVKVKFGGLVRTFEDVIINQEVISADDTLEVVISSDLEGIVKGNWQIMNGLIVTEVV